MKPMIYLDNSATTPVHPQVVEAMLPFITDFCGNPSSLHSAGRRCRGAIDQAREQVATMLGASPREIFFTPNATYSNNLAIMGRALVAEELGHGKHIITSCIEHASALKTVKHLQSRGWRVTALSVNREGLIDINQLKDAITSDTSIISIMWANNEVGTIQPIQAIAEIAFERGIFFHTDAVQAAGKVKIDLSALAISSLSLSGHKFHAPKGIAVHYLRNAAGVLPINFGGEQENGMAPGTENVANIVALGAAADLASGGLEANRRRLEKAANILRTRILQSRMTELTGPRNPLMRVPGHLSVVVRGQSGRFLVEEADRHGVCIANTSACSSAARNPSHVLRAMGFSDLDAQGAVRISAGILNTDEECSRAAETLSGIFDRNSREMASVPFVMPDSMAAATPCEYSF